MVLACRTIIGVSNISNNGDDDDVNFEPYILDTKRLRRLNNPLSLFLSSLPLGARGPS